MSHVSPPFSFCSMTRRSRSSSAMSSASEGRTVRYLELFAVGEIESVVLDEEGDIEQVRLAGIDERGLGLGDGGREEGLLDGVGVDPVVDLGERALEVPAELETVVLVILEPLEFLDEVELELHGHPGGELEGDVLVGVGATVASGTRGKAHRAGFFDPLLRGEDEAVQPGLHSNPVEFDGIKIGIVEPLPDSEKLDRAAGAQPIADHIVRVVGVLEFGDIRQAEDVLPVLRKHRDGGPLDFDGAAWRFAHGSDGGSSGMACGEPFAGPDISASGEMGARENGGRRRAGEEAAG